MASTELFETKLVTSYYISREDLTKVNLNFALANRTSSSYAQEYAVEIGSINLKQLEVRTTNGPLLPYSLKETATSTIILINFPKPAIGLGATQQFQIRFLQADLAVHTGKVLEISIPKQFQAQDFISNITHVHVPNSYGEPDLVSPPSQYVSTQGESSVYTFVHTPNTQQYIRAIFGSRQFLSFTLNYHLQNTTVSRGVTQIALPPDTPYQKVFYNQIQPRPDSMTLDPDGNWLASFTLEPKHELLVTAQGSAILYSKPTLEIGSYSRNPNYYLKALPYWEVGHNDLKSAVSGLSTPRHVYDYVVENLAYNYQDFSSNRLGALEALRQSHLSTCWEFTDVFVAMGRTIGVPTRAHTGFAYTNNPNLRPLSLVRDVLHAWPEYFDVSTGTWIQVDPTWGNTTGGIDYFSNFDLNHFTFAIHGLDSSRPYPAGLYKTTDLQEKDIIVETLDSEPVVEGNLSFEVKLQPWHLLGLKLPAQVIIRNGSNIAHHNMTLSLSSSTLDIAKSTSLVDTVLPYTARTSTAWVSLPRIYYTQESTVLIDYQDDTYEVKVKISSSAQAIFWTSILGVAAISVLVAFVTRRVLVFRRAKASHLRR